MYKFLSQSQFRDSIQESCPVGSYLNIIRVIIHLVITFLSLLFAFFSVILLSFILWLWLLILSLSSSLFLYLHCLYRALLFLYRFSIVDLLLFSVVLFTNMINISLIYFKSLRANLFPLFLPSLLYLFLCICFIFLSISLLLHFFSLPFYLHCFSRSLFTVSLSFSSLFLFLSSLSLCLLFLYNLLLFSISLG